MSQMSGKIELPCTYFEHPNKGDNNDCPGTFVEVGGEFESTTKTRLRCDNKRCQRVVTIEIARLQAIYEHERQQRYQRRGVKV